MLTTPTSSPRWRRTSLFLGALAVASMTQTFSSMAQSSSIPNTPAPGMPAAGAIVPAPSPSGEQIGRPAGVHRQPSSSSQPPSGIVGQNIAEGRVIEDRAAILDARLNESSRRAIKSICRGC